MKVKKHSNRGFQASLETIYKTKKTSALIRIFNKKLNFYKIQAKFFCDTLVRYKYLEMLKIIRSELIKRGVEVDIFI